jgi:hypothetical protein
MKTTQREAMEMALEALENHTAIKHPQQRGYRDDAIAALRAALADWLEAGGGEMIEARGDKSG